MSTDGLISTQEMSGTISKIEFKLPKLESFVYNGGIYYHTRMTLHRPYELLHVDFLGGSIFMYIRYGFIQNFEVKNFIFFFGDGPVETHWDYIGSYPVVPSTGVNIFKKVPGRVLHVFSGVIDDPNADS